MPDPAIESFFQKRKEDWIKKETKPSMNEEALTELQRQSEDKFSFENWLPAASRRAGQISISTHPCTFSHPSARKNENGYASPIIATPERSADGYLRTGNVEVGQDALGNAAALDVYKLLSLTMDDGEPLHTHIERETPLAKELLNIDGESYEILRSGFLAMFKGGEEHVTSSKIKQIYFPVVDSYHLLSVLSNSGMIYELRKRVDELRFSERHKQLREKRYNNEPSDESFAEIYNLTTIGYGGTKPQNISVLNNQFGGKARLLISAPPHIINRSIQFPRDSFFKSTIRFSEIEEPLRKLHNIFITSADGIIPLTNLQAGRDHRIQDIIDQIVVKMAAVRAVATEQYRDENSNLPHYQRIWLYDDFKDERAQTDTWLRELCQAVTRWIHLAYQRIIKNPVLLGPAEIAYLQQAIVTHREVLR